MNYQSDNLKNSSSNTGSKTNKVGNNNLQFINKLEGGSMKNTAEIKQGSSNQLYDFEYVIGISRYDFVTNSNRTINTNLDLIYEHEVISHISGAINQHSAYKSSQGCLVSTYYCGFIRQKCIEDIMSELENEIVKLNQNSTTTTISKYVVYLQDNKHSKRLDEFKFHMENKITYKSIVGTYDYKLDIVMSTNFADIIGSKNYLDNNTKLCVQKRAKNYLDFMNKYPIEFKNSINFLEDELLKNEEVVKYATQNNITEITDLLSDDVKQIATTAHSGNHRL